MPSRRGIALDMRSLPLFGLGVVLVLLDPNGGDAPRRRLVLLVLLIWPGRILQW